jgi:hypothetical protein
MEYLVNFIVADDQVSPNNLVFFPALMYLQSIRVVECPEFRQLCMVLRESLVVADFPGRHKVREAIVSRWKESFNKLKVELSVSFEHSAFPLLTLVNRNPAGVSVLHQIFGQTGIWQRFWH